MDASNISALKLVGRASLQSESVLESEELELELLDSLAEDIGLEGAAARGRLVSGLRGRRGPSSHASMSTK